MVTIYHKGARRNGEETEKRNSIERLLYNVSEPQVFVLPATCQFPLLTGLLKCLVAHLLLSVAVRRFGFGSILLNFIRQNTQALCALFPIRSSQGLHILIVVRFVNNLQT